MFRNNLSIFSPVIKLFDSFFGVILHYTK